jgi:hypothetical protein
LLLLLLVLLLPVPHRLLPHPRLCEVWQQRQLLHGPCQQVLGWRLPRGLACSQQRGHVLLLWLRL